MIDDSFRSERSDSGALARFTRDLTADARAGRLEMVRCRDEEIARTIDILLRQGKNNPALVGAAGVGKTAIAEGLAQRIAAGTVPVAMRDLRLLSLDSVALLAGTTYRGQYEERLRALVAETSAAGDVLLFVDEMHNLIGQGSASGSAMDAANMLKPALARGEFRMLGATTDEEYERWILGDPALERRFQKIAVRELSPAETLEILRTRMPSLARHHHVVITDAAIRAVDRAHRHLGARAPSSRQGDRRARRGVRAHAGHRGVLAAARVAHRAAARLGTRAPAGCARRRASRGRRAVRPHRARRLRRPRAPRCARSRPRSRAAAGRDASPRRAPQAPPAPAAAAARPSPSGAERAALDIELERQLLDEGIVVRGHDVARVVGLMIGRPVEWEE